GIVEDNVIIKNKVFIGKDTRIMSGTYIEGPVYIGEGNKIGPNAHIRPYSCICNNCHIGNSSEVKNSIVMSNTNFPHFNYVGDSIIGEKVNFGAGTKIANLKLTGTSVKMIVEGKIIDTKRRKLGTIIGDNVKTGISTNIVCGVKVGENSLIGANTLVNEDIPPKSVYYADFKNIILKKQID
ncbi:MAG: glucose-1-phosphate thymidylyltransferase, partial [Candidatus Lokiarchaeota archaeon]|nr:glucose-1-phosphate thymidylyltransferase [Candidatus Lokiarchaeota archaeon]